MSIKIPHISIEITPQCNLNCKYCYNHWKAENTSEPFNSYKKTIKTLKRIYKQADVDSIAFTGGEPFLSERFEEVVLFTRMKNKKVSIISNGNACDNDQLLRLIKMGVQLFELPMHSKRPEVHDAMTTVNGSWQKSYNSIRTLIKNKGYVVPVIVVTKLNHAYIEETIEFLAGMGLKRLMINRFNIGGNGIKALEEINLPVDQLRDTFKKVNVLSKKYNLTTSSNVCTPFCVLDPDDYPNVLFGACPPNVLYKPLTINIDGDLRLCNHSPVVAGNIFKQDIADILTSDYVKSWNDIKPDFCLECTKYNSCRGGCRAASEQMNLGLSEVDPMCNYPGVEVFRN